MNDILSVSVAMQTTCCFLMLLDCCLSRWPTGSQDAPGQGPEVDVRAREPGYGGAAQSAQGKQGTKSSEWL